MAFFTKLWSLSASLWRPGVSTRLVFHRIGCYSSLARRSNLMAQFHRVKEQYQDYILLFQVGDFYEMYGEDASIVSSKTNLRLTSKKNIFMCGFPVKALNEWQKTLVLAGFQLAICDQSPPTQGRKGTLLERDVVKMVTPGTLIEPLHNEANYLLSVATAPGSVVGLAWADISTAEVKVSSCEVENIDDDLERISPSEVLLPDTIASAVRERCLLLPTHPDHMTIKQLLKSALLKECHLTGVPGAWYSDDGTGKDHEQEEKYLNQCNRNPEGIFSQLENLRTAITIGDEYCGFCTEHAAISALLRFIKYTQREVLPHLSSPTPFSRARHMSIDANTRRALELVTPLQANTKKATLLGTVDTTVTAAGGRLLKDRLSSPLTDRNAIERRLAAVEVFFKNKFHSEEVVGMLKTCEDIERIVQKVATKSCNITDLQAIKNTLSTAGKILDYILSSFQEIGCLEDELNGLQHFDELVNTLEKALSGERHGDYITQGYSNEVDTIRGKIQQNHKKTNDLISRIQSTLSITRVAVMPHKTFFRVLEMTKTQAAKAEKSPDLIRVDNTQSKTRFSHAELQKLNAELAGLESSYSAIQENLFKDLCEKVMLAVDGIMRTAHSLARLDVASALGLLASERGYCKPSLMDGQEFGIVGGFHPVVTNQQLSTFVENDCHLEGDQKLWVITGPNMGGKSTFLRQNALISILAQMGSFVPAESAVLGLVDRVFARVGASDNVSKHMSTFHLEMSETAHVLCNATSQSLVILDEIGRGTSYGEGFALARAIVEYLHDKIGCRCLVATHYHQLALLGESLGQVSAYMLQAKQEEDGIVFTYKIEPGYVTHSCALEVAALCGLPSQVIQRAKSLQDSYVEEDADISRQLSPPPLLQQQQQQQQQQHWTTVTTTDDASGPSPEELQILKDIDEVDLLNMTPLNALDLVRRLKSVLEEVKS